MENFIKAFDGFIKGPLTSILGILVMVASWYAWRHDGLTDYQSLGSGTIGFALLFMRDKLPEFIGKLFNAVISKFSGSQPKEENKEDKNV